MQNNNSSIRKRVYSVMLGLIFLILFNAGFFLLAGGDGHPASVWISYGFIHVAYILFLVTAFFPQKGKSADVYHFSLCFISGIYFVIELIVGMIFIFMHPTGWKIPLLLQIAMLAACAALLLSNMLANTATAEREAQIQNDLVFVRTAAARLEGIMDDISDAQGRKLVESAYDAARNCQVKSLPVVAALEEEMLRQIDAIGQAAYNGSMGQLRQEVELFRRMAADRERQLRIHA